MSTDSLVCCVFLTGGLRIIDCFLLALRLQQLSMKACQCRLATWLLQLMCPAASTLPHLCPLQADKQLTKRIQACFEHLRGPRRSLPGTFAAVDMLSVKVMTVLVRQQKS